MKKAGRLVGDLPRKQPLAVGFGCVTVMRDEDVFWRGDTTRLNVGMVNDFAESMDYGDHEPAYPSHQERSVEQHTWTIRFEAPLSEKLFIRRGHNHWELIDEGPGFA